MLSSINSNVFSTKIVKMEGFYRNRRFHLKDVAGVQ